MELLKEYEIYNKFTLHFYVLCGSAHEYSGPKIRVGAKMFEEKFVDALLAYIKAGDNAL